MFNVNSNKTPSFKITLFAVAFSTLLSACSSSNDTVQTVENKQPTVVINAIAEVESGTEVRLTSTASDPDGSIVNYQWSQKSGDMVLMRDKDQPNTSFYRAII